MTIMKRKPLLWCFVAVTICALLSFGAYSIACAASKGKYSVRLSSAERRGFYFEYGCLCRTFDKNNQPVDVSWSRGLGIIQVSWQPV
jgi:hypothetical protein